MRHKACTLHDFIYIKLKSKRRKLVVLQVQVVVSLGSRGGREAGRDF